MGFGVLKGFCMGVGAYCMNFRVTVWGLFLGFCKSSVEVPEGKPKARHKN